MTTFAGLPIATKENFFEVTNDGENPIEFAFGNNETGYVYENGTVYFNNKGIELYEFNNTNDAFAYFFGEGKELSTNFVYKMSRYIGDRDTHPTLEGWCKRMGIKTLEEEDGSSVYTDWKEVTYDLA